MKASDESTPLTFQWRDRDRPLVRLVVFLCVTIAGAAGFFLLFKVVYPQPRHFPTAPQQVLILDPAQPATRDIVNRTSDENFLLLSPDSDPTRPETAFHSLLPVFRPGFAGFEMTLMDIPGEQDKKTLPRVYGIDDMPLPPIATVMKAKVPAAHTPPTTPPVLRVVLRGALDKRELASSRDLAGIVITDAAAPRFRLCVNNAGLVIFALPLDGLTDPKQMRALYKGLSGLRFKPVNAPATQWGDASFVWENARP